MSGASSRSRFRQGDPTLSELDLRILDLLSRQRVLTQTQLAALLPETPARTLRYRCARLADYGLLGRTRPYRERGSAPHHLWPTRKGEAIASGSAPPRGGERREPNPLFLAHAAGLSELYVSLARKLPGEAKLARFAREGEAREPFADWAGRERRAIAPDALVEIRGAEERRLLAFVELDMGTMSHRRLKEKVAGYAEYARVEAWRERHRFCPALLFITTTEKRARSFLAAIAGQSERSSLLLTGACDRVRDLERCVTEPCWLLNLDGGARAMDLLGALGEARRPYEEEREQLAAQRREEEDKRDRLRSDPEALRTHLRCWKGRWGIERLPKPVRTAVEIALEGESATVDPERRALLALGALFDDPLHLRLADREPSAEERAALDGLASHYRSEQLRLVGELAERFGEGPALRNARERIEAGELLGAADSSWLKQKAEGDQRSRAEQQRLRGAYLRWREAEAKGLAKAQGLAARLRKGPEDFLAEIDQRSLRCCADCEEISYPDPERARYEGRHYDVAGRCHFCGSGQALAEIESPGQP